MEISGLILTNVSLVDLELLITKVVRHELESFDKEKAEFITRNQTAQILGISLPTLNEWSKKGIIKSYKISTRVRYKREEVLQSVKNV